MYVCYKYQQKVLSYTLLIVLVILLVLYKLLLAQTSAAQSLK